MVSSVFPYFADIIPPWMDAISSNIQIMPKLQIIHKKSCITASGMLF